MPKVWHKYIKSDSLTGIWKITESEEELRQLLHTIEGEKFANDQRTLQWLSSRVLLQELLADMGFFGPFQIHKNERGRPGINLPGMEISISHAGEYAAAVISTEAPVGLDIEQIRPKISRIKNKFMNEADLQRLRFDDDLQWMHLVWSAKEALFKYDKDGELDFKEHLHIDEVHDPHLLARIQRGNAIQRVKVPYQFFEDYVITWAIPSE